MRLAHLSDTHLGYQAYAATTAGGANQREVDVIQTFRRTLEDIESADPDLVIHAGDFFHKVRPSNATIVGAYSALASFQGRRDGRPFVIVAGNHEIPRTAGEGNILSLFQGIPGVMLAARDIETMHLPGLDAEILCVPSHGLDLAEDRSFKPAGSAKHKILVLHGVASQTLKAGQTRSDFDVAEIGAERFDYVALGDFHGFEQFSDACCYSGSTDFTSSNIWEEAAQPKGWVLFDFESESLAFHPISPRTVIDLPVIDAAGMVDVELEAAIKANATWVAEKPIVRQKIINVQVALRSRLPQQLIAEIRKTALHYQVDARAPLAADAMKDGSLSASVTIEQSWDSHVESATLPAQLPKDALKEYGRSVLLEVAGKATALVEALV